MRWKRRGEFEFRAHMHDNASQAARATRMRREFGHERPPLREQGTDTVRFGTMLVLYADAEPCPCRALTRPGP